MTKRHWLGFFLALAVVLSACGGGGGTATPEPKWDSAKFDEAVWK